VSSSELASPSGIPPLISCIHEWRGEGHNSIYQCFLHLSCKTCEWCIEVFITYLKWLMRVAHCRLSHLSWIVIEQRDEYGSSIYLGVISKWVGNFHLLFHSLVHSVHVLHLLISIACFNPIKHFIEQVVCILFIHGSTRITIMLSQTIFLICITYRL